MRTGCCVPTHSWRVSFYNLEIKPSGEEGDFGPWPLRDKER